jgi:oligopeptide transport system permease protein
MTSIARPVDAPPPSALPPPAFVATRARGDSPWRAALKSGRVAVGGGILLLVVVACLVTLPWTLGGNPPRYEHGISADVREPPPFLGSPRWKQPSSWMGYDALGRSMLIRCLLGGLISLGVGVAAATISVVVGVTVGLVAGYRGGWVDALLMRTVDVLYGLPYILLVILFKIAFEGPLSKVMSPPAANLVVLFSAIGLVSWLTMARVIRGQVLSLRAQPFVEACRALGLPERRIFLRHMLPNLVGPITVYATLTVPSAILQESFLSFLGVGVNPPMPTWGSLAGEAIQALSPVKFYWWMLVFPCALLAVTLLSLNFLGDGLRDVFDPKREAAKL